MLRNLQNWFDIASIDKDAVVFVMCDNEELIRSTQEDIDFRSVKTEYIRTDTNEQGIRSIAGCVASEKWQNAAMAHLTTFFHSRKNGITRYWNIDADDTLFCIPPKRAYECLKSAEEYADMNEIDLFSLDMWRTKTWNLHWSFGITYTNNPEAWIDIMVRHKENKDIFDPAQPRNLDGFFTCLKRIEDGIATFYVENLRFIHYSNDLIRRPWQSGVYHWKDGKLSMPILKDCLGLPIGEESIPGELIKLDIGVTDDETSRFMIEQCFAHNKAEVIWRCREKGWNTL